MKLTTCKGDSRVTILYYILFFLNCLKCAFGILNIARYSWFWVRFFMERVIKNTPNPFWLDVAILITPICRARNSNFLTWRFMTGRLALHVYRRPNIRATGWEVPTTPWMMCNGFFEATAAVSTYDTSTRLSTATGFCFKCWSHYLYLHADVSIHSRFSSSRNCITVSTIHICICDNMIIYTCIM